MRQIVRTTTGGDHVRVVLSNTFGTTPLSVDGASIARRDSEASIVASSSRALTFDGQPEITIPAGAYVLSDPVDFAVSAVSDLAIDLYLPGDTAAGESPLTMHTVAAQTNYVSEQGNHVGSEDLPVMTTTQSWFFLARVEVMAPASVGGRCRVWRLDHRRHAIDTRHEQPLAKPSPQAFDGPGDRDGRAQYGHRRQPSTGRMEGRQRARPVRS